MPVLSVSCSLHGETEFFVVLLTLAARHGARRLLPVHPEHLRSPAVHSARLDRRYLRVVPIVHHRFHVLRLC